MINLSTNVQELNRVGKSKFKTLGRLDIKTVKDLIYHFPYRYEDFSKNISIKAIKQEKRGTIKGKINFIENHRSYKTKITITEAIVSDNTDSIKIVWFNQPFIKKTLRKGDQYYFSGDIETNNRYGSQIKNPVFEKVRKMQPIHTGRIVPIYPSTSNISQKQIRFLIHQALFKTKINDWLPKIIKDEYNLMELNLSLKQIHFPQTKNLFERARKRLKFNELFLIHIRNRILQEKNKQKRAPIIKFKQEKIKKFVDSLPFKLTDPQKKTSWEIIKDLEKNHPMNRLLEGDVGSGKTVVAMIGMLNVALNNFQVGYMAPTEILAKQHFLTIIKNLKKYLKNSNIALLTNDYSLIFNKNKTRKVKKDILIKKIQKGDISIIIGTHALIQKQIKFKKLAFIIIDEQHRFGVSQRSTLNKKSGLKNLHPHFLSMSATPMPRSVALTLYGDLNLSIIDKLPPGRKPVETKIIKPEGRLDVYSFIRSEIKKGRQAFVICPLIDPSDKLGVKSATKEHKKLKKDIFPKLNIGLIHGKLKNKEKQETIEKFKEKEIDILVSTTVVEVGIDIPNASIILIEGAQRFGLAQLHQLRGRIGRSKYKSYCFLFTNNKSEKTTKRLKALLTSKNGFELAKKDLEIRGPGEVFGEKQSGFTNSLKIARLSDVHIIEKAKNASQYLFKIDPKLKNYPELKKEVEKINFNLHLE